MTKVTETDITYIHGTDTIVVYTARKLYISQIEKWQKQYPDLVNVIHRNDDGSLVASIPSAWFRFPKPSKKYKEENNDGDL